MSERIHLSKADITTVEEQFVLAALRSGWIAPLGPDVEAFEADIADRVGVAHALALSSGTAALHLALLELGAGPGKAVILPSMTFAASANAVVYTGAEPVFVDSRSDDGNVDPSLLLEAVDTLRREGQAVAAVMTVDLFGRAADYSTICPELDRRGIALLEDAAEALGASHAGRAAGSFGRASALSFNGNKIMTTSGGGMLLSDDSALVAHARKLSTQSREPVPWYEHKEAGYNYRLSNILAALGRGQLSRLDDMITRRRAVRARYRAELGGMPGLRILGSAQEDSSDNCWLTCVTIEGATADLTADAVVEYLNLRGIEARHLWKPMHTQPFFRSARAFGGAVAEHLFHTGFALPSGSALTDDDIQRVIWSVTAAVEGLR